MRNEERADDVALGSCWRRCQAFDRDPCFTVRSATFETRRQQKRDATGRGRPIDQISARVSLGRRRVFEDRRPK